ncbi:hypothetical protein [Promicromonospora umidemergens]|uniref:Uncharacterized protein n=1 Tax=Promicromonospora umidemergens TaxID=629679 RepID=A0ABP8XYB5_9MICO|nr:hypothetical protein [Promicromonospora umidemergens]
MKDAIFAGLIVTVVGGLIVVGVSWIVKRVPAALRRVAAKSTALRQKTSRDDAALQLVVLREQVREVAREQGLRVPDRATGQDPTIVTYTHGHPSYHFSGHAAYKRVLASGRADPLRSSVSKPPQPISRWTEKALRDWLAQHATSWVANTKA